MKKAFQLSEEKKKEMIGQIQEYFESERNEQIGNLSAMLLLDFFIEKFAAEFYNLGVEDSHTYMVMKLEDLFEIQK